MCLAQGRAHASLARTCALTGRNGASPPCALLPAEPQLDLSKQTIFGGGDQSEEAWREIDKKVGRNGAALLFVGEQVALLVCTASPDSCAG